MKIHFITSINWIPLPDSSMGLTKTLNNCTFYYSTFKKAILEPGKGSLGVIRVLKRDLNRTLVNPSQAFNRSDKPEQLTKSTVG